MLQRIFGALLVVAVLSAPTLAWAAPDVERAEVQLSWVERVWEELRGLWVPVGREEVEEAAGDQPRQISAGNEAGPTMDPEG